MAKQGFIEMKSDVTQKICLHHVGGRAGSRAFPILKAFEGDFINVLYDADTDCLDQIRERNADLASSLQVLPYCLASSKGSVSLKINYDPYTSSLYEANPEYGQYYVQNKNYDYLLKDATAVMEERSMEAVTLDDCLELGKAPQPDFLSLDTQGAEYDILLGAQKALSNSVLAVVLEAEFQPIYRGQKLFGDICRLLSENGFVFARFLDLQEAGPYRYPVGLRGQGFQMSCDALFLKKLDVMTETETAEAQQRLRKTAMISLAFNQVEYALEALGRLASLEPKLSDNGTVYGVFLDKLSAAIDNTPKIMPQTFKDVFPDFDSSRRRFNACKKSAEAVSMSWKGVLLKKVPQLFTAWRVVKRMTRKWCQFLQRLMTPPTAVEKLFREYGLNDQARLLKEGRLNKL